MPESLGRRAMSAELRAATAGEAEVGSRGVSRAEDGRGSAERRTRADSLKTERKSGPVRKMPNCKPWRRLFRPRPQMPFCKQQSSGFRGSQPATGAVRGLSASEGHPEPRCAGGRSHDAVSRGAGRLRSSVLSSRGAGATDLRGGPCGRKEAECYAASGPCDLTLQSWGQGPEGHVRGCEGRRSKALMPRGHPTG